MEQMETMVQTIFICINQRQGQNELAQRQGLKRVVRNMLIYIILSFIWLAFVSYFQIMITEYQYTQATINIDLTNKPFHSPKIKTNITKANGLDSEFIIDVDVQEVLPNSIESEITNVQGDNC